jgi:hypothetical protein
MDTRCRELLLFKCCNPRAAASAPADLTLMVLWSSQMPYDCCNELLTLHPAEMGRLAEKPCVLNDIVFSRLRDSCMCVDSKFAVVIGKLGS